MKRVNDILHLPEYQKAYHAIQDLEKDRTFCGHDMVHFLNVARLSQIYNLKEGAGIEQELLYAAALLHDIGRHLQYLEGIPHHKGSASLAAPMMKACGFAESEICQVTDAILSHRGPKSAKKNAFSWILYRADKASRCCFSCNVQAACDWPDEKKNMSICD